MFSKLFGKDRLQKPATRLYRAIVAMARTPKLYLEYGVPDTVDGRFDMVITHAIFVFRRLREDGEAGQHYRQLVFDIMFDDMDAALREMGTGDLSVGKKIREMGEAFYGRANAVDEALSSDNADAFENVLQRNLFAYDDDADQVELDPEATKALARYFQSFEAKLKETASQSLFKGELGV